MNIDRFKFRIPFYDKQDNFLGFEELDIVKGIEHYNYGKVYYQEFEQCTGTKDYNGELIYEGDIVKQFNNHGRLLREGWIVYNEKEMKFKIRTERCPDWNEKTDDFTFHPLKQRILVIGNIHKDKELLNE